MTFLKTVGLILLVPYGIACLALFVGQRTLQYIPNQHEVAPASAGLSSLQTVHLVTTDGERLLAWYAPPREANNPVVLYLHGNGGNLANRADRFAWMIQQGWGFLALDWRGYGGSTGTPTEQGLREDARTAWCALVKDAQCPKQGDSPALTGGHLPASRVVIFGESLGTTLAVLLAADVQPGAVVLDSALASALDVGQRRFPWLPISWLMRDPLRADLAAPRLTRPVLQIHCHNDPIVPFASGQKMHALLPQVRPLVVLEGRCHTPALLRFQDELTAFVAEVLVAPFPERLNLTRP